MIVIHILLFCGGYKVFEGMPIYQIPREVINHIVGFSIKVYETAEAFEPLGNRGKSVALICIITLVLLSIWSIKTDGWKKYIRDVRRVFSSRIPPLEYDELNNSYKGHINILSEELEVDRKPIENACNKSGFKEANIVLNSEMNADVKTEEIENYIPTIEIGNGFLTRIKYTGKSRNMLLEFAIAHELSHVRHNDPINLAWTVVFFIITWFDGFMLIGFSINILSILAVPLLMIWLFFFMVFASPTFWSHSFELRADREALDALGYDSNDIFNLLSTCYPKLPEPKRNKNILYGIFRFTQGEDAETTSHPTIEERKLASNRVKKWTAIQYLYFGFRYQNQMIERMSRNND